MTTEREEKVIESHVQEEMLEEAEEAREAKLHAAAQARRAAIEKNNADARAAAKSLSMAESYAMKRDEDAVDFAKQEEALVSNNPKTELETGQSEGAKPMTEEAKKKTVSPLVAPAPDPFDAKALRLPPAFEHNAGIRKVISTIPVRKPHGQEWIRVRADEGWSDNFGVIILRDDNEVYLLHPNIVGAYENEMTRVRIFVCLSMNKNLFLWPAKLPGSGHKGSDSWNASAIEAAEAAMKRKVRIQSNRAMSAYEYAFSDNSTPENDPVWPDLTYSEMLRIGFAKPGRFVTDHNHEVLRLLREG